MSDTTTDTGEATTDDSPGPVERIRSVSPLSRGRPDAEMDVIGWSIFLGLVILVLPLLPVLIVVWAITKVIDALDPRE